MATDNMTVDIQRLMKVPEKIRNIGVCAHIDHGKCVAGSSRLLLDNGEITTAKQLFKLAESRGIKFEEKEEHTIYDVRGLNLNIYSLNKETGETEMKPVSLAWKLKGGSLIKLKLRNGFTIATTPEHKFIVCDNLDFVEKQAKDLTVNDRIVCPRRLDIKSELNIKNEILLRLAKKRFYAWLNPDFNKKLRDILQSNKAIVARINTEVKYKSFYHGSWQGRYLLKDLIKLSEMFNIGLEEVYDNIDTIVFRNGAKCGKNSKPMSLPRNFENFFYLAGLFIGDGTSKKFIVGKEKLGRKFVSLCNELNINVTFRNYSNKTPEIVTHQTLLEVLNSLFDYPKRRKSHNVRISDFVLRSPKECSSKLLKGYFDTDGCVERGRRAVTISSASNQMIEDLSLFLLRFSCIPILEKDNTISISGLSLVNFVKNIGFGLEEKSVKAHAVMQTVKGSLVSDVVQVSAGNGTIALQKSFTGSGRVIEFCEESNISLEKASKIVFNQDLAFIQVKSLEVTEEELVYDFTVPGNHNFVAEGMFIHNTTFSDNLLMGAGMLSEETAGKACALDFHKDEQERGITIDSANVSMVHVLDGEEYLINLIDTPGHVDFGGDVTRAMRAVDGAIVLCCAVEGIMPQTETVLRQALKEKVKPVLFINKVDRLIKEVKLTPEAMSSKFMEIISEVNRLIEKIAPVEFKQKWKVSVQEGSVAFGSAFHKWALSFHYMKKAGLTFKDVIDAYEADNYKELAKKAPLHNVILDMVVRHHPNPKQAQLYRIPRIWHGDLDSEIGRSLLSCDPDGPVAFVATKIVIDKHAGEVAAGRLFSGTIRMGDELYMNQAKRSVRIQQVSVYKGAQRVLIESVPSGNIVGLVGLKGIFAGETVSTGEMDTFEELKHLFEPVVTKSIAVKNPADLTRLIEVLKQVGKEDPSIRIEINEETGENLMSGMGELHLEIIENRIKSEKGLQVVTSPPIVVYREAIQKLSPEAEGKSPNKHNKLYFTVEPLPENLYEAIKAGDLPEMRIRSKDSSTFDKIISMGIPSKEAKNWKEIFKSNVLVDDTRGIVHIGEIISMVMDGFEQVMDKGGLAEEPCMGMLVKLKDCKLHEDAIHRGPAQMYPAVRDGIREAIRGAKPLLFEPLQEMQIDSSSEFMGALSSLVQNKRGQLLSMDQEGEQLVVKALLPVAELIMGWSSELRSATSGRGSSFVVDQKFAKLPEALQQKVITQIRQRKRLSAI